MIRIDEERIFDILRKKEPKPKRVAFNGPEGIIRQLQIIADKVSKEFNIEAYIIGDTCYGSCDINLHAAKVIGAEILFHVGHTISMPEMNGGQVIMINAFDDISFDEVAKKCITMLRGKYKDVAIVTDSQHLHQVDRIKDMLSKDFNIIIGEGKGQLNNAQVFGCEFYPAFNIRDKVEAYIFLGQSMFHAAGVAISTGRPTYMLDPYFNEVIDVSEFASKLKKRSVLSVYKALDAEKIGIVVGLKEGQFMFNRIIELKKQFEKHGKHITLIALTEVTEERLRLFDVDAFIQVACPRISIDNTFSKPVLSVPQANTLLRLLNKEELKMEDYLTTSHWL